MTMHSDTTTVTIARLFALSRDLLLEAVSDLSDEQWFHQPIEGVECIAWLVGHMMLVDRSVLEQFQSLALLPIALSLLPSPEWEMRFGTSSEQPYLIASYDASEILDTFAEHRQLVLATLAVCDDTSLDRPLDAAAYKHLQRDDDMPFFDYRTIGEMLIDMGSYIYSMLGELSAIRQAMGLSEI